MEKLAALFLSNRNGRNSIPPGFSFLPFLFLCGRSAQAPFSIDCAYGRMTLLPFASPKSPSYEEFFFYAFLSPFVSYARRGFSLEEVTILLRRISGRGGSFSPDGFFSTSG